MKDRYVILISFIATLLVCYALFPRYSSPYETTLYDDNIYQVTAPFGIITHEANGKLFFLIGSYNDQMTEKYIVKYFHNGELQTKILDATKVSIVNDGKFVLETKELHVHGSNLLFGWDEDYPYLDTHWNQRIIIHVPNLPSVSQSLTNDYRELK